MTALMDAVLTHLVRHLVRMPGAGRWDLAAVAQALGVMAREVQLALQALETAGLAQCAGTGRAPSVTDAGLRHLFTRVEPDTVLPGFVQVSVTVLDALGRQSHVTAAEVARHTGLFGDEVQPHLHLMQALGLVTALVHPDGSVQQVC